MSRTTTAQITTATPIPYGVARGFDYSERFLVEPFRFDVCLEVYRSELKWLEEGGAARNLRAAAISGATAAAYSVGGNPDADPTYMLESVVTSEIEAAAQKLFDSVVSAA